MHGTLESVFRIEWRPLPELAQFTMEWQALAGHALEPNVFYEPAFALAAQSAFGGEVCAGLVWSHATPRRLVGLFPARVERRYGPMPSVLVGWTHPYAPLGTPLVDRDLAQPTIAAWLDHLAQRTDLPKLMLLPLCPIEGAFAQAFDSALARRGDRCVLFGTHRRALLMPAGERASYVERAVGSKKLKELRRQKRRLGDIGVVMWSIASEPAALASALPDFLDLEAGGWKGRAGTAAKSDPEIRAFMEAAVPQLACDGKARIARLFLDARPIAAIILLRSGDTEWCWKIAYDESVAQASPGVQLLIDVTQVLLDDVSVTRADSCATPDHPMIDHIWRERLALSDRLIGVSPAGAASFALARALETGRGALVAAAKRTRHLLRR